MAGAARRWLTPAAAVDVLPFLDEQQEAGSSGDKALGASPAEQRA